MSSASQSKYPGKNPGTGAGGGGYKLPPLLRDKKINNTNSRRTPPFCLEKKAPVHGADEGEARGNQDYLSSGDVTEPRRPEWPTEEPSACSVERTRPRGV